MMYSADGYIINQDATAHIPYGRMPSDYSGCGWIAAYNFLRVMGKNPNPRQLARQLATGWFKGGMGTGPLRLRQFLAGKGYRFAVCHSRRAAPALAHNAKAGILMYVSGIHGLHYVTFAAAQGSQKRFFNAEFGNEQHILTMAEFAKKYVKTPFCYLMVAR